MKTSYNELLKYAKVSDAVYGDTKITNGKIEINTETCDNKSSCVFVNNNYEIIAADTSHNISGAQAMLFKDGKSGEYVLSIRGTEFGKEFFDDAIKADGRILTGQVPMGQFMYIVNFIEKEVKPIVKDAPIVITGHSLGGTLAELVGKANNGLNIKQVISYNSPSANKLSLPMISSTTDGSKDIVEMYFLKDDVAVIRKTTAELNSNFTYEDIPIDDKNMAIWLGNILKNQPNRDNFLAIRANDVISPIANLWDYERIGELIEIPGISHSIVDVIDTLKTLAEIENGLKEKGYSQDEINNNLSHLSNKTTNYLMHNFYVDFMVYLYKMKIISNLHNMYAKPLTYDPLVLDLNNNGRIDTITLNNSKAFFDHNNDNIAYKSSWISKDDGLLVLDKNNNNLIDNGNELFGNFTEINLNYKDTNQKLDNDNIITQTKESLTKLKPIQLKSA
ncbi:hypothetical protein AVCANL279_08410 [Campylobacter canadensis]|uniref:lipase family protein n=1 Tax=Campylobacter canadensis TaxID=449520 RepID=UPI0015524E05|nr:hypothetical protein [Campylobacter canadensis]MBZ7995526.1 hypothetical protein [Campylobacter canadensis]MBZ7997333.1 hypothetical protein [Campylobacter canadensis]MBZ8000556.1 hypothetical protein [Campylobacter canadensis]MBZ8002606.1 hypothetical protein [Campylobacter canadensis]MBZ8003866.1 hypothetical protein [Campylobacter canadensis]